MEPLRTSRGRRSRRWVLVLVALLAAGVLAGVSAGSPALRDWAAPLLSTSEPHREITDDGRSPTISFIDSPSPTCYLPEPGSGACYIQWSTLSVSTDTTSTIISMTVTIDDQLRAYHGGFFQSAMVIPSDMTGAGYKVVCGMPAGGAEPGLGNSYRYALKARDSAGLKASNSGTVTCPADVNQVFVPTIQR